MTNNFYNTISIIELYSRTNEDFFDFTYDRKGISINNYTIQC